MIDRMNGLQTNIDKITTIIYVGIIVFAIGAALVGFFLWRYVRQRRSQKLKANEIDYTYFERKDAKEYVKFDDIKDSMIISNNGTVFTGAISCRGYDFASAHSAERISSQSGYRGLISMISKPIAYRQYDTVVDLADTKKRYEAVHKENEEKLFYLVEDYNTAKKTMNEMEKELGDRAFENDSYVALTEELVKMQKQMEDLKWRRFHLEDQLAYISQIGGTSSQPEVHETYLFSWQYIPMDFPVDLSEEEVYKRAVEELDKTARSMIAALSSSGVRARRCDTKALIEMYYRHMHPITADSFKMKDIDDSGYFEDIVSTTEKDALKEEYYSSMTYDVMQAVGEGLSMELSNEEPAFENKSAQTGAKHKNNVQSNVKKNKTPVNSVESDKRQGKDVAKQKNHMQEGSKNQENKQQKPFGYREKNNVTRKDDTMEHSSVGLTSGKAEKGRN